MKVRQAADDQREIELAALKAEAHQRIRASEDAVHSALAMYGEGVSFADLPDEVTERTTPAARLAARTVYTQQLAGETAPYNRKLEAELHAAWLNALDGDASAFLKHSITELNGAHDPARFAYWQQRKDELTAVDAETQTKTRRRMPWYKAARRMIEAFYPLPPARSPSNGTDTDFYLRPAQGDEDARLFLRPVRGDEVVEFHQRDQVLGDAITYIDDWHEANPSKMMEPGVLREFVGAISAATNLTSRGQSISAGTDDGDGSQKIGAQEIDRYGDTHLLGGAGDDILDDDSAVIADDRLPALSAITEKLDEAIGASRKNTQANADELIAGLSKETITELGEIVLSLLPGTGNVMSARDAVVALAAAKEAVERGDYGDATLEGALAALGFGGAVPGAGVVFRAAKNIARGLAKGWSRRGAQVVDDIGGRPTSGKNHKSGRETKTKLPGISKTENPISVEEFHNLPEGHPIDAKRIRTAQSSAKDHFSDETSVAKLVDDLRSGKVKPGDVPAIAIIEKDDKLYALDHRRLIAHREAGVPIRVRKANSDDVERMQRKFTSEDNGMSVEIGTKNTRKRSDRNGR